MAIEINASTKFYASLSIKELRLHVHEVYKEKYIGKCVTNKHLGIKICFISDGSRKLAYGGSLYSKKACLVDVLDSMLSNAKFNNWGNRKIKDKKTVVGYLNFKTVVLIDEIKENIRLSVQLRNDGKFYYNHEVNIIKQ